MKQNTIDSEYLNQLLGSLNYFMRNRNLSGIRMIGLLQMCQMHIYDEVKEASEDEAQ